MAPLSALQRIISGMTGTASSTVKRCRRRAECTPDNEIERDDRSGLDEV